MSDDRIEVSGLNEDLRMTCLDCGRELLPENRADGWWPSLAILNAAAALHRCEPPAAS